MDPTKQCLHFLNSLYGDLPEGMWFHLWAPDKRTRWFQSADEAATWALAEAPRQDVYCGVSLSERPLGEIRNLGQRPVETNRRIAIKDAAAVVGLIADLDFACEAKPDAIPDEATALEWLAECELRPTAVVHSGHGLHVWWLHKEPWYLGSEPERKHAVELRRGWHNALAYKLDQRGWSTPDAVHDLSRVLRVAGTANHKQAPAIPVRLISLDDAARFEPDDFEEFVLGDEHAPKRAIGPSTSLPLAKPDRGWTWEVIAPMLRLNEPFPHQQHEVLCANSPEYKATWEHKRPDLRGRSLSQWDMALVHFVAQAGWTPSEIGAVIRDHRLRHGDANEKASRVDYLARTIAKALNGVEEDETDSELQRLTEEPPDSPDARAKAIETISSKLDLRLENIQRVSGSPPLYLFWAEGKCAPLKAESVTEQGTVAKALFTICGRYPRTIQKSEKPSWRDLVNIIAQVAEEQDAGSEATFIGELAGLLEHVCDVMGCTEQPAGGFVTEPHRPFTRDGRTWFRIDVLMQHLPDTGMRLTRRELCQRLRAMGCEQAGHHCEKPGRSGERECLQFWGLARVPVEQAAGMRAAAQQEESDD